MLRWYFTTPLKAKVWYHVADKHVESPMTTEVFHKHQDACTASGDERWTRDCDFKKSLRIMPVQTQCWNSKIGGTTACNSVISSSSDRSTNRQRRRHGIRKAVHYDNLDCQVSSFRRQSFHHFFQLTAPSESSPYFLKKASPPILRTDWAACDWQQYLCTATWPQGTQPAQLRIVSLSFSGKDRAVAC